MMDEEREREPAEPTTVLDATPSYADPETVTLQGRRETRLANLNRDDVSVTDISKPLLECGCGGCSDAVDPLEQYDGEADLDMSFMDSATWAKCSCPDPRPLTVERAGEVFRRYARANLARDNRTSKPERELSNYRGIMERDRYARWEFGDRLTTVLLSFRVSPILQDGIERRWANPILLADVLLSHRSEVHRRIMNIRRHVDELHYCWVVTGTERYATPHYHVYLWCDDGNDDVRATDFTSARDAHIDGYQASVESHPIDRDGNDGCATIRHSPDVVDTERGTIIEYAEGETLDMSVVRRAKRAANEEPYHEATKGAIYVATQLPYLAGFDADAYPVDNQTAAIKWCHSAIRNRRWFGCSELTTTSTVSKDGQAGSPMTMA